MKMVRAVFLDRDGVINKEVGHISKPEQFELLPKVGEAIRLLNKNKFKVIVISNQTVIARGEDTIEDIENIHKKMKKEIEKCGAHIDAIYYCPHHPDKGFPGERVEYKINCDCRKPKIGLLKKAVKKFNIYLKNSFFIGDKTVDIQTGKNAGCKTILVKTGYGGNDKKFKVKPDFICEDLLDAVDLILKMVKMK